MGHYDPDVPFVIGSQFAPLVRQVLNLDTGSEIGFTFEALSATHPVMNFLRVFSTEPLTGLGRSQALVAHLYDNDDPGRNWTPAKKITIPCTSGAYGGGASLIDAATVAEALNNPSNYGRIHLVGASSYAQLWFGTTDPVVAAALTSVDCEILDVTVKYLISSEYWPSQPGSVTFGLERPATGNWVMDDQVTGPTFTYTVSKINTSRLGELNPWYAAGGTGPFGTDYRLPWTYESDDGMGLVSLSASGGDNINLRISNTAAATGWWDINYVALEVTYRESCGLYGAGGLQLTTGCKVAEGLWAYDIPMAVYPDYNPAAVPGVFSPGKYTVMVGKGHCGVVSVTPPNPIPLVLLNSVDTSLPGLSGFKVTKNISSGGVAELTPTTQLPSLVWYEATPFDDTTIAPALLDPDGHAYIEPKANPVSYYSYTNPVQIIENADGTFKYATFYAKRTESTDGRLIVYQCDPADAFTPFGPSGEITVAEFDELPEIVDGWKRVTVELSPTVTLTAGTTSWWRFDGGNDSQRLWLVLGCSVNPTTYANTTSGCLTTYGGSTAYQVKPNVDYNSDLTLWLSVELDTVTGLAVTQLTQDLSVVDTYCNVANHGIPTGIVYNHITWTPINSAIVAGWSHYDLQRRDTTMDTGVWETIGYISTPSISSFDDYEARIGVQSQYRIRMVFRTGLEGPWSATATSTIASPGVTGTNVATGLLCLTSNTDPTGNLAYVHVTDSPADEDFTFVEASQNSLAPVFNRDYQVAMRPSERGGVTFTRTMLVNMAGVPSATLDSGFQCLRDLAWAQLPYVCVRNEAARRWLANINTSQGKVRRIPDHTIQMMLAELVITEVADEPAAYAPPQPWLGVSASRTATSTGHTYITIETPTPTALRTAENVDIRMQVIPETASYTVVFGRTTYDPATGSIACSWAFDVDQDGTNFGIYDPGFYYPPGSFYGVAHGLTKNRTYWIRMTYERNYDHNGSGRTNYYSSPDNATWTLLGTETDTDCSPLYGNAGPIVETFEASTLPTGWAATNGTIVLSSAQKHAGAKSALLTVTGTPASTKGYVTHTVQGNTDYSVSLWVRANGTHANVAAYIDWYNSAGALISTSTGSVTLSTKDTWVQHTLSTVTAPTNAETARIGVVMTSSPPTGESLYLDDVSITGVNEIDYQGHIDFRIYPGITVCRGEVRSSIGGTIVASPDFVTPGAPFSTVTDIQSNVWTVEQA